MLLTLGCAGILFAACRLTEDTLPDGAKQVRLENDLLRVTFSPALGGQCTGIVLKQAGNRYEDFTPNLFDDMDWSRIYYDQVFTRVPYTYRVLVNTPALLQIALERQGTQDFSYIVMKKVVTLRDGECACQVDYDVRNLPESMGQKSIKLSLHNGLYPKSLKGDYYWSTPGGVKALSFTGDKGDNWEANAPRGWSGVVNVPPTSGIACVMDYKDLATLYDYRGGSIADMEWRYIPKLLHNGDSFCTTVWVEPFTGLPRIDHAGTSGVYAWVLAPLAGKETAAILRIAPVRDERLHVALRWRKTTEKDWHELPAADVLIMAAAVADWRPRRIARRKHKKAGRTTWTLDLVRTPDILATLARRKGRRLMVGFAAETGNPIPEARRKLHAKNLDLIVANDVTRPDAGFEVDTNRVTLLTAHSLHAWPTLTKRKLAQDLIAFIEHRIPPP